MTGNGAGPPCGYLEPAVEVSGGGQPTGFYRGRCGCGWVSVMARARPAEADTDAESHFREGAGEEITGLARSLAQWQTIAAAVLDASSPALAARLAAVSTEAEAEAVLGELAGSPLGAMIAEGERWIINAHESERRAVAYRSGGDAITSELRRRLDAAWDLLTRSEEAGRTVAASALREALDGTFAAPDLAGPVTAAGQDTPREGNPGDDSGTA